MSENAKYDSLLVELRKNRSELSGDVFPKIIKFRENIDAILPDSKDFKNRFALEQKMKSITYIINSELSIRKQIDDSIKLEFDLSRKTSGEDTTEINISKLAEAIESIEKNKSIDE